MRVIDGPINVNVAEAVSAAGFPVAVMTYGPAATLATTNEAVRTPPDTEHVKLEIEPASLSAHVVSPVEKPAPDTWIVDPT
jgi:TRAP-type C4-dicarboxylate transport system substrate-binding protein